MARHEGGGTTHQRLWVLVMQHVATWQASREAQDKSEWHADCERWAKAVLKRGKGGDKRGHKRWTTVPNALSEVS